MGNTSLTSLSADIRACRICINRPEGVPLPHPPRPVAVLSATAQIRIIGQAPGTRVHRSGKPFTDPSGDRLRDWMQIDADTFYDPDKVAITPMGFCFPGQDAKGGDLPPRKECAPRWHPKINAAMPAASLVLLVGQYAQTYYLKGNFGKSLTETVNNWRQVIGHVPDRITVPLPHPSWRNNSWIKRNPWFERDLLPYLRAQVAARI